MTLTRSNPRAKSRWLMLVVVVAALVAAISASALAALDPSKFELDKNASNDLTVTPHGELGANTTAAATVVGICQTAAANLAPPFTILVEAERMSVTAVAAGTFGGNCANKRDYTVTRAQGGTTATAHAKGNPQGMVSLLVVDSTQAGPDWDQVFASVSQDSNNTGDDDKCVALGLVECSYINDGIGPSIFIGGATKDHLPVSGWSHTTGGSPDKGEILNAYAAKALGSSGQELLYFGMDRWAVDGSTDIGFWFFRSPVVACPDANNVAACAGVPDGSFVGNQTIGDVLVLGTFTQGGATSDVRVFTWVGTGGNESGTISGPDGAFGDCVPSGASSNGCATVNNTTIEAPWGPNYSFKGSAKSGWIPLGGFFEGGIDLTFLGLNGCFSSFLAETRSSPEITAVLKDFALGQFESCGATLTTTPGNGAAGADNVALADGPDEEDTLPEISIGTGSVQVRDRANLAVTGISTWSGTLDFWLCKVDGAALCDGVDNVGTKIGSAIAVNQGSTMPVVSDPATVTSVGRYCWRGVFTSGTTGVPTQTDATAGECFEVTPVTPIIATNATAAVEIGSELDDTATLTGTATKPTDPIINPGAGVVAAPAGGTITFKLYGPSATASCVDEGAGANLIATRVVTVSGDRDGTGDPPSVYRASDGTGAGSLTPSAAGAYYWIASYSGDSPNTNARSGACGDANETSVVVDASITLDPLEATNDLGVEGGDLHDITATVQQDVGAGFVDAPDGTTVTFSLLNNDGVAEFLLDANDDPITTCTTTDGECTITIKGLQPGSVDVHATTTFNIGTVSVTRSTDGTAPNSGDANKIFVDASIAISPLEDENNVESEHVFTITVTIYPDGAELAVGDPTISPILTSDGDDVADSYVSTCDEPVQDATDSDIYTCTVTINNNTEETFTLNASMSATVEGLAVSRTTEVGGNSGPGGSGPAIKVFIDGSLVWLKHDQDGELLAGATFEVCQTHYLDTSGELDVLVELVDANEDPAPACESVLDDDGSDENYAGLDEDPDGGEFLRTNLTLGTWTIRETAAPDGYAFDDTFTQTVYLTLEDPDGNAATAFVNTRLFKLIVITCNESTSELVVSLVGLGGETLETFGSVPESWGDLSEAAICDLTDEEEARAAVFGGLDAGIYEPTVTIPKPPAGIVE